MMNGTHKTVAICAIAFCAMLSITISINAIYRSKAEPVVEFVNNCAWGGAVDDRRACSEIAARLAPSLLEKRP
jgi:hypothetical protein